MKKVVVLLFLILLFSFEVFAQETQSNYFFQICDFEEAQNDGQGKLQWTRLSKIGCTPNPVGDRWKEGIVFILPGHSAKGLGGLPEKDQAEAALGRAEVVRNTLAAQGFSNFVVLPLALEFGSKVVIVYVYPLGEKIDLEKLETELKEKLGTLREEIEKVGKMIPDDLQNRLKEIGVQLSNLEKCASGKKIYLNLGVVGLFLPERAIVGPMAELCYVAGGFLDICAFYGLGGIFDYSKEARNEFLAHFIGGEVRFNFPRKNLGDLFVFVGPFYTVDMDKKFYGNRDFKGGRGGVGYRYGSFSVGGFGLVGAGTSVPGHYRNQFTLGGGVVLEVRF